MDERRIFARIDSRFPVKFLNTLDGSEGNAATVDISANGLCMVTNKNLVRSTRLELSLKIPDQHTPLYTRGEVVWVLPSENTAEQRVGVHLEKVELMGLARVLWAKAGSVKEGT